MLFLLLALAAVRAPGQQAARVLADYARL